MAENRADIQQRMTNYLKGFDEQGNPNELGKTKQDLQLEQTQAALNAVKAEADAMSSQLNKDTITNTLIYWTMGEHDDALNQFNSNIVLKNKLAKSPSLNIHSIDVPNWDSPQDVAQIKKLGIDTSKLKDPEVRDALNRSFMRVQGHDGTWRLASVDDVMKQTNTYNMMSKKQRDGYALAAQHTNGILKGLLPRNQDAVNNATDMANKQTEIFSKALETGDPKETMFAYMVIHPEKFIGQDANKRRDRLAQSVEAFAAGHPNATKRDWENFYQNWTKQDLGGKSSVREDKNKAEVVSAQSIGRELLTKPDLAEKYGNQRYSMEQDAMQDKQFKKPKEEFDTLYVNYKELQNLNKTFQEAVKSGSYKSGYFDSFKNWVAQVTPEQFHKFTGMSEDQIATTIGLQGSLGMQVAKYLKSMSGTAASENEAERTLNYIVGNSGRDEATQAKLFSQFVYNFKEDLTRKGKSLVEKGFVGETFDKYKDITAKPKVKEVPEDEQKKADALFGVQ
jgi:hypothetical protein